MQTRRDQLQAYRFVTRRVMAALLHGEPDAPESPMRKLAVATFSGIMVAVLVVAGFGVWGLVRPGGAKSLTEPGTLIIEKETGTNYVYREDNKRIYPVANYVSARLILDTTNIKRRSVSHKSLREFERGPTLGISGAPDSLVDQKDLIREPWVVCTRQEEGVAGQPTEVGSLLIGRDVGGTPLGDDFALVVRSGADKYVIWRNKRMRAVNRNSEVIGTTEIPVDRSFLRAVPAGPDFAPPPVPGRGEDAQFTLNGNRPKVGTLYESEFGAGDVRYNVAMRDGLASVSETEAKLLIPVSGDPVRISASAASNATPSKTELTRPELPSSPPRQAELRDDEATPLCATYNDSDGKAVDVVVTQGGDVGLSSEESDDSFNVNSALGNIDRVEMRPGGGALVGALPGPGQADAVNTYYLISEQGIKFRLASPDVMGTLGYGEDSAVLLPVNILDLIPEGPSLDPEQARKQATVLDRSSNDPKIPLGNN